MSTRATIARGVLGFVVLAALCLAACAADEAEDPVRIDVAAIVDEATAQAAPEEQSSSPPEARAPLSFGGAYCSDSDDSQERTLRQCEIAELASNIVVGTNDPNFVRYMTDIMNYGDWWFGVRMTFQTREGAPDRGDEPQDVDLWLFATDLMPYEVDGKPGVLSSVPASRFCSLFLEPDYAGFAHAKFETVIGRMAFLWFDNDRGWFEHQITVVPNNNLDYWFTCYRPAAPSMAE